MIKTFLFTLLVLIVAYVLVWAYVLINFVYVWECDMYTGEQTIAEIEACNTFHAGGMKKVLTNL